MKLMIVGNADSIWIQKLVERIYLGITEDIVILTENNNRYCEFYEMNNVKVYTINLSSVLMKIPILRKVYYRKKYWNMARKHGCDIAHIHFLNINNTWLASKIKTKMKNKVVATFWGSDLLDVKPVYLHKEFEHLKNIDAVTVSTNYMRDYIYKNIPNINKNNVKIVKFGADILPLIDTEKVPIIENTQDKLLLAIGYNGRRRQNHISVISELSKLSEQVKNKLHVLIQMSYAVDNDMYKKEVKDCLERSGLQYTMIEKSLSDNELARLRNQVDIFIHAQKTDAFSASVMEYLYSETFVLNPEWIRYEELIENNVEFYEYQSFDEISESVQKIINMIEAGMMTFNKQKIKELMSWEIVREQWTNIFVNKLLE